MRASVKKLGAFVSRVESGTRGRNGSYERSADDTLLASERSIFSRRVPGYHYSWRRLRLRCAECDDYLLPRLVGAGRFAPCRDQCGFAIGFDRFIDEKHKALVAHLTGSHAPWPYVILDGQRGQIEPESDEWFGRYYIGEKPQTEHGALDV
jgi:hypothetical protein